MDLQKIIMKKYIVYTFFLVIISQASFAQDENAAAKKRLQELRARKAQIELELQQLQKPDKSIITEIIDGKKVTTVKNRKTESPIEIITDTKTEKPTINIPDPISSRKERRKKRKEQPDIVAPEVEIVPPEIEVVVNEPEPEIDMPKLRKPRRERRNKRTEDIDVTIGEPETPEMEVEEPAVEVVVDEEVEIETPKTRKSRRERRNKRNRKDVDITIEAPEMDIEEPAVEVIVDEPEMEIETPKTRKSRRERRNKQRTEDIEISIGQDVEISAIEEQIEEMEETPKVEIEVEDMPEENMESPEVEVSIDVEDMPESEEAPNEEEATPEVKIKVPKARKPRRDRRERRNRTKDIEATIEEPEAPEMDIEEPAVEVVMDEPEVEIETPKARKPRRERRNKRTEDIDISIGEPDAPEMNIEEPAVEVEDESFEMVVGEIESIEAPVDAPPVIEVSEEEVAMNTAESTPETPAPAKPTLGIDVVEMPNTASPEGITLSDEATLAMTDILTATPPASVPPEVTFYDEKLKLIVGEMAALTERSALLPANMERINQKLRTIESQFIAFEDMKAEPAAERYMNFMQMNIDVLQNIIGSPDDNSPTGMLMEAAEEQVQHEIFFDEGSDKLSSQFHESLESLVQIAKKEDIYLVIEAPDVGDDAPFARRAIERNRVNNIRDFLMERGVPSAKVRSIYMGDNVQSLTPESVVKIQIFQ